MDMAFQFLSSFMSFNEFRIFSTFSWVFLFSARFAKNVIASFPMVLTIFFFSTTDIFSTFSHFQHFEFHIFLKINQLYVKYCNFH